MQTLVFILGLFAALSVIGYYGFTRLPKERWQILFSIPIKKAADGTWNGLNFTWYGFIIACSYSSSVALYLILMSSIGVGVKVAIICVTPLLFITAIASKWIARIVENKANTFTIGGAVFAAMVAAPPLAFLYGRFFPDLPAIPMLSAMAIAYALGEGAGRLACVSFGCCYGRTVEGAPRYLEPILKKFSFSYEGDTKKISYASGLASVKVIPVQAYTYIVYNLTALVGAALWLNGFWKTALISCIFITQAWRFYSETLRADYRGEMKVSAYQYMSMAGFIYVLIALSFFTDPIPVSASVVAGLKGIWNPSSLIFIETLWILMFIYMGKSFVTGSNLRFFINHGKV
jgi:hypothetical protein